MENRAVWHLGIAEHDARHRDIAETGTLEVGTAEVTPNTITIIPVSPSRGCQQQDSGKRKQPSHDAPPDSWKQLSHSNGLAAMTTYLSHHHTTLTDGSGSPPTTP